MAFTFETSGNNTFLVYAIQEEDVLDTMTLGMITNNRIPGMASVLYTQMNQDCFLKYNVTAKVTVRQFFSGVVNKRRLLGVFSGVAEALAAAEEYMIDNGSLLLDMDYIYADVRCCRAEVVCLPVVRETGAVDSGLFFKNIMFSTQFDQTENCDYVARIINYLNSTPVFAVEDFLRLLEELQGTGGTSSYGGQTPQPDPAPQTGAQMQFKQSTSKPQVNSKAQPQQPAPVSQVSAEARSQQPAEAPRAGAAVQSQQSAPVFPAKNKAQSQAQSQQPAPTFGKQGSPVAAEMGFAVPGQGGDGGFAVPGQGSDGGFAVPGQGNGGGADSQAGAGKKQKKAQQKAVPEQSESQQPAS